MRGDLVQGVQIRREDFVRIAVGADVGGRVGAVELEGLVGHAGQGCRGAVGVSPLHFQQNLEAGLQLRLQGQLGVQVGGIHQALEIRGADGDAVALGSGGQSGANQGQCGQQGDGRA